MRPIRNLKPVDFIIRGLFLSAVVIGGIVGHLQQTEAAPETATNVPVLEAGLGLGFGLPVARQCAPTDAGAGAPAASSERQPASQSQALSGSVRSSDDCAPVGGAKIEFWPAGKHAGDSAKHATSFAGADGRYHLQCELPADEAGYIYMRVSADGYDTLTTQFTPRSNRPEEQFDIVLQPGK